MRCLIALVCGAAAFGADLTVAIRAAGSPTAAAVRLYDARGRPWIPANALDLGSFGYLYGEGELVHYADWTSTQLRSLDPFFGSSYFRVRHPPRTAGFFVDGGFRITLPEGMYTLEARKGLEYLAVQRTIHVAGTLHQTIDLERWVDMARSGWYSGDGHVHLARNGPAADDKALLWAAAEDVHVLNVLLMGDARRTYYPQHAWALIRGDQRAIIPGQEDPRTTCWGHTLHLGLREPVRDPASYYSYVPVFERVKQGGGLNGFAHAGRRTWRFNVDRGLTLTAPLGLVDFAEIAQMGYIGVDLWFQFLDLGFRLTAMAGSDVPWGGTAGSPRVYAFAGRPFEARRWLDAVRRGHTFVTTGPMLEFTVDGMPPGTVIPARAGQKLEVRARAWSGTKRSCPARLKIVSFGHTLRESAGEPIRMSVTAEHSFWITAVCETNREPLMDAAGFFSGAVATPVYVEVDGAPCIARERVRALVTARLASLDAIERVLVSSGVGDGAPGAWESDAALGAARAAIRVQAARARKYYLNLQLEENTTGRSGDSGSRGRPRKP